MKHHSLAITFLAATAFSVACKPAGEKLKDGFQQARQWVSDKIAPSGGVSGKQSPHHESPEDFFKQR